MTRSTRAPCWVVLGARFLTHDIRVLSILPCHEGGSCRNFIIASGRGCGNEAVSLSGRRLDVARSPPAVLELDAKISDVAVDEVAPREVIRSPEPVEDLIARERDLRIR